MVVDGGAEEIGVGGAVWYSTAMVIEIGCVVAVNILGDTAEVVVVGKRVRHSNAGRVSVEV